MSMLLLTLGAAAAQPALPTLEEVMARHCPKLVSAPGPVRIVPLNQMPPPRSLLAVLPAFDRCSVQLMTTAVPRSTRPVEPHRR